MSTHAAATRANHSRNGTGPQAESPRRRTATETPPDTSLENQAIHEEVTQQHDLRRLPSPRQLWSDSEVSDEGFLEEEHQTLYRTPIRTLSSAYEPDLEDPGFLSASPPSPNPGQLFIALENDQPTHEMDLVAQFVGYPESEFEEESDHEFKSPRSKAHRGRKLSSSNAPNILSHTRSITRKFPMNNLAVDMEKKLPLASETSKAKAKSKKSKRAPLYQSSSSEDDQPVGGEGFADGEGLHKPSLAAPQTSSQAQQQPLQPELRQTPVQAPSPTLQRASPSVTPQATGTKALGSGLRARLQEVIAMKGMSPNSPQYQGNNVATDRTPISGKPSKGPGQVSGNTNGQWVSEGKLTNGTVQARKLPSDDRPRAASSSASTQRGNQDPTPSTSLHTQRHGTRTPRGSIVNRPPAYGPFNASQQRQTPRQKQPASAPAPANPGTSKADGKGGISKERLTTSSYPSIATDLAKSPSSDPAQELFTPASTAPNSKTSTPTDEQHSALLGQTSPFSATGRPATPARMAQGNQKANPRMTTVRNAQQTKPVNHRSTITEFMLANTPTQTTGTTTVAIDQSSKPSTTHATTAKSDRPSIPVGGTRPTHQSPKETGSTPKSRPSKQQAAQEKTGPVTKPARTRVATRKPTSAPPPDPKPPMHKPAARTLHSILTEVSSGDGTVESVIEKGIQNTQNCPTDNVVNPIKVIQKPPTISSLSKHELATGQLNDASKVIPRGPISSPAPMPLASVRIRIDDAIVGTNLGTGGSSNDKSKSTARHSRKDRPHGPMQISLQPSGIRKNPVPVAQPRTTSPDSLKSRLPAGTKGPCSHSRFIASWSEKLPASAHDQISVSSQTKATTSIEPQVSPQPPSRTSLSAAPKAPPAAYTEPRASTEKPVDQSSNATTAATKQFTKTHVRFPSGPTEDGFDIYIPPAPGAPKAVPISTSDTRLNATTMPATPGDPSGEVSTTKKLTVASAAPSLGDGEQCALSEPTTVSTTKAVVSTSAPIPRQDPLTARSQATIAGRSARIAAPSGEDAGPVPATLATVVSQGPVPKDTPAVAPLVSKPSEHTSTTIEKPIEVSRISHCLERPCSEEVLALQAVPQARTGITPLRIDERTNAVAKLPEVILRDIPKIGPPLEPYFEYRVKQKIWPESGTEQDATTLTVGFSSTVLETANRQAEELFARVKHQYLFSFPVQDQQSSSGHTDEGCLELVGTLASIGWPVQQVHLKIWVERGEVPPEVAVLHPAAKFTPFLSKTLYILRLYKLTEVPVEDLDEQDKNECDIEEEVIGDEEPSASAGDESSSDDSDNDASDIESDPDEGKYNKKRQAKEALKGSPPPKRRKTTWTSPKPSPPQRRSNKPAPPKRVIRQHHQIPCPEIYTCVDWANSAACNLQIEIIDAKTPLSQAGREHNAARLRQKLMALADKEGEERYWRNEFVIGLGGDKMEIIVEQVGVCGPRNV